MTTPREKLAAIIAKQDAERGRPLTDKEKLENLAKALVVYAPCSACDGEGAEADYVGLEMKCVAVACSHCGGSGKLPVGVFDPICARHCTGCEGSDHHWTPYTEVDDDGESLMCCKHCPALRPISDDDE